MRVALGPVPSSSVTAWVDNALLGVSLAERGGRAFPFAAPSASLAPAIEFFAEWVNVARADPEGEFRWAGDVDGEVALHLLRYWHNIGRAMLELSSEGEVPKLDPGAEQFADALLRALLDGLVAERRMESAMAERMWRSWPRIQTAKVRTDRA